MAAPSSDAVKHMVSADKAGAFRRGDTPFHNWVKADGSTDFPPESGRYHLYVAWACPWAHRCMVTRQLKGLTNHISASIVDPFLDLYAEDYRGWAFNENYPDHLHPEFTHTKDLYLKTDPTWTGRCTVPILWDKKLDVAVSTESAEIIQMFNSEFNEICDNPGLNLMPEDLVGKCTEMDNLIYPNINDGVYRCGFARSQEAYDEAFQNLFNALDQVEEVLSRQRYVAGDRLTLSDVRLWTTLVRFDHVYVVHFKCNKKRIVDYPNLWGFTREIYQMPGIADLVKMDEIKFHYYESHIKNNPRRIVARGPDIDFMEPHGRGV